MNQFDTIKNVSTLPYDLRHYAPSLPLSIPPKPINGYFTTLTTISSAQTVAPGSRHAATYA